VRSLGKKEPFASILGNLLNAIMSHLIDPFIGKEVNPGPSVSTDAEIATWAKTYLSTTYHTAGSCSMLPKARGGVVGPDLVVYGTRNVRVVDLSIVPLHVAAHTQATVYAIAEQGKLSLARGS